MENKEILDLVSVIISALGFGAVIISLWNVRKALKSTANNNVYQELHHIHSAFLEYPKFRPLFYHQGSTDILKSDEDHYRAQAICELFFDVFEYIHQLSKRLNNEQKGMWSNYMNAIAHSSPYLVEYLYENIELVYPESFRNDVNRWWQELQIDKNSNVT